MGGRKCTWSVVGDLLASMLKFVLYALAFASLAPAALATLDVVRHGLVLIGSASLVRMGTICCLHNMFASVMFIMPLKCRNKIWSYKHLL